MAVDITMPRLSDSMEEGTVAKWHVEVGATVERGQVLAEIDTDKATMEYEAESDGVILAIVVQEGESAPVGAPIARLGEPGEPVEDASLEERAPSPSSDGAVAEVEPTRPAAPKRNARENASPVARGLAAELGVDLGRVQGSGPGGLITKEDVQRAAGEGQPGSSSPSGARGEVLVELPTRMQQVIARRMVEGSAVPTFAVEAEIDMSAVVELRAQASGEADAPSLNDYVVRAAALALREFPRVNGSYGEQGFELHSRVNVGIAVASEGVLVVPVVFDADTKSVSEIGVESRRLAVRAREAQLTPAEVDGGTFTVTNLGMFGASRFLPIVNPPQAAILAVGAVTRRPAFDDDSNVVPRDALNATLVCDHRIVYGADGARFLARVQALLQEPEQL